MTENAATQPSPPPRPLTAKARCRAWIEPRVRFWWLAAIALLGIIVFFGSQQVSDWSTERNLIVNGTPIKAVVEEAGGIALADKKVEPNERVLLTFNWKGERKRVEGYLLGRKDFIITAREVDIRVDPNDPTRWTSQTEARGLLTHILGNLFVLPLILLSIVMAIWSRSRVLRIWRDGEARRVVVVENHQTSLAPLSRVLRCAPADGNDKRLATVYVPQRLGKWEKGDALWVVSPVDQPQRALAAMVYE